MDRYYLFLLFGLVGLGILAADFFGVVDAEQILDAAAAVVPPPAVIVTAAIAAMVAVVAATHACPPRGRR